MKTLRKILTLMLLAAVLLGAVASPAAADGPSPQDEALLALINQARRDPLVAALTMGLDPEKIVRDFPELEKIFREGLPALAFNENLYRAARAHTRDMFANRYYSQTSPDGRGYGARINEAGYPAGLRGESLGLLYFANFIRPGDALRLLFENLFRDELDPARTAPRNILNPRLREAGVSVDMGVLGLGGALWNVYLATCDFGAAVSGPEEELLALINQARANPLGVARSLGIDTDAFLQRRPELREAFTRGLKPLTPNDLLAASARAQVADMLQYGYYGTTSADGRTYGQRLARLGYRFAVVAEAPGIAWVFAEETVDPLSAAGRIFRRMLREELSPANAAGLTILDPRMAEAGIAVREGILRRADGQWEWRVYLAVCDLGMPPERAAQERQAL